jgi:transposase
VTRQGLPLALTVGPGHQQDWESVNCLLDAVRRAGRAPLDVHADGAYDTQAVRSYLRRRRFRANIPVNRRKRQQPKRGRPYRWDEQGARLVRSSVERFFAWLKGGFRRLALRYERLLVTFLGFLTLACVLITWRLLR